MQLFKLNASYLPGDTVKDFDSLIWTERYLNGGDFKLTKVNDFSLLSTLPLGSLISHTDTSVVMIVENYEVERDKEKKLVVTLTGRTFETFAENRVTAGSKLGIKDGSGNSNVEVLASMASCSAAVHILKYALQPGTASANDEIPNLLVVEDVSYPDTSAIYQIQRGDVYSNAISLLKIGDYGIKTIRPDGSVQTTLNVVVYDGVTRVNEVVFTAKNDDLSDASYFGSIKADRNYAQIAANTAARLYRDKNLASDVYGLSRRLIYVPAEDLEGAFSPPANTDAMATLGQAVLNSNKTLTIMDAKIAETAKPKFKIHYDIGDIVMVIGEFNTAMAMRVTEHILTKDDTGIKGYPGLSVI